MMPSNRPTQSLRLLPTRTIRIVLLFGLIGAVATVLSVPSFATSIGQRLFASAGAIVAGSYVEFLYDGTNWRLLELMSSIVSQTFTASGTYTPTSGMTFCIVEAVGGGAGGGGVVCDAAYALWAGGGGAGGYSRKVTTAALVGASQVVTIGAGGAGGAFGAGSNGGDTSLGSICIAKGGSGGFTETIECTRRFARAAGSHAPQAREPLLHIVQHTLKVCDALRRR